MNTQLLTELIEAHFNSVGPDIPGSVTESGQVAISFHGGSIKWEGEAAHDGDPLVALRAIFPDHAFRRLRWRKRPEVVDGAVSFRFAADRV